MSTYPTTRDRYLVLASFALSNAANAFLWISFSPIFANVSTFWGVSAAVVNWFSLSFLILYLPGALIASVVTERWGLRSAIVLGAAGNALGAWIRYAGAALRSPVGFGIAIVGQCVAALAQPVFTNSPARLSADWFPRSERDLATVGASLSNAFGNAAGSALPAIFVASANDLPSFLLYQAIACSVLLFVQAAGMRSDEPVDAPSAAAAAKRSARSAASGDTDGAAAAFLGVSGEDQSQPQQDQLSARSLYGAARIVARDYGALLSSANFRSLTVGFGLGLGLFNGLLTLLGQILSNCGYDDDVAGYAGGALLAAGLVSAGFAGVVLEKTRAYVTTLRALICTGIVAICLFLAAQRPAQPGLVLAASAILGAVIIPLLPVSLENAAECSFPVPEEVSSGLLIVVGNYIGIVLIFAMTYSIGAANCSSVVTPLAGVILGTMCASAASLFLFKMDYKRQAQEISGE